MKKAVILVVAGVIKSGCAGANLNMMRARCADRIDLISIIDQGQFEQDITEYTQYAADVLTKAQNEAVARAIIGGDLVGAAAGAAIGCSIGGGHLAKRGAAISTLKDN